ncbi:unnamed protein product [Zymoseptoria tritici ST99CH_1A5]|uniref:ATP-dependent RNA helicase PRP5/DDX46/KHDC4 KH domain-containing protein n=2 Tax=Zymoseptoria tritici TaxID=1047171 RepID=A0A2H1GUM4_ZYMTR|nr:unnamed protein product [Zymoseptoria tritici ST99CH_1E4]SMR60106.1 unnamed protein product [Zymoseptoria tritici ST99CH_3D1]SMY27295.1 unnamed protein product [Zymoseptoria tritici ST99CH_1A5]
MSAPSAFEKAQAAAAKIAAKVSKKAEEKSAAHSKRMTEAFSADFHATLELNNLPLSARVVVTQRTAMAKISDQTGAALTPRGRFYPGDTGPTGFKAEPKLNIFVEGQTEMMVRMAISQINDLIRGAMGEEPTGQGRDDGLAASEAKEKREKENDRAIEDPYGVMEEEYRKEDEKEAAEQAKYQRQRPAALQGPIPLKWQTSWAGEIVC